MPIKILCVGDVVGKPGRLALAEALPKLVAQHSVDLIIVNAENVAGGSGITPQLYQKIMALGVDVITLGDHTFRKREIYPVLDSTDRMIRPVNFPPNSPGKGFTVVKTKSGVPVAVMNLMGRMNMNQQVDEPFGAFDAMLAKLPADVKVKVLDFHAEVSSEKIAMGWHVDGRISLIYGTHTHTPTADARVLPGGTAFVSDLGMTGPYDSVLGRRKDRVLKYLTTAMPQFFEVATGDPRVCGIVATIDELGGQALSIERIDMKTTEQAGAYDADDGKGGGGGEI